MPPSLERLLRDQKTELKKANTKSMTLLFYTSHEGHVEVARILEHQADVNQTNIYGDTPLIRTFMNRHVEVATPPRAPA